MRFLVALAGWAGCAGPAAPVAPPLPAPVFPLAPPAPAADPGDELVKVTLADVGLDAAALDRTMDPCIDFDQFACGGWIAATTGQRSRSDEAVARADAQARMILEDAGDRRLRDFYAACLDEGAAARPELYDRVTRITDARSWLAALIELHRAGRWVVWRVDRRADRSPILGAPTPASVDRADIARAFGRAGMTDARARTAADAVAAIEGELAKLRDGGEIREVALASEARSVDWRAYWKAVGDPPGPTVAVAAPALISALDALRARFTPAQWGSYFGYQLLASTTLAEPRAARCVAVTRAALAGDFAAHEAARAEVHVAIDAVIPIAEALATELGTRVSTVVGPVERTTFEIKRDDFAGNLLRAKFDLRLAGEADPIEPYAVAGTQLVVPLAVLQPPYFGASRGIAVNLGAFGTFAGRALASSSGTPAQRACLIEQYAPLAAATERIAAELAGLELALRTYRKLRVGAQRRYLAEGLDEDQQFFLAMAQAACSRSDDAPLTPAKLRLFGALRNTRDFARAFHCAPGTPMAPARPCGQL